MRKLVLLAGLSCIYAVRLDVSDEFKNSPVAAVAQAVVAESVDEVKVDPSLVVITAGFEKCRVLVTSNSKFSHFKKNLKIILPSDKFFQYNRMTDWVTFTYIYWQFQTDSQSFKDAFFYPSWDDDEVKFNFHLTQYDTEKTHVAGHFVNLPARRVYIIVVGSVEHSRESDRREDDWKPKYACSGDTRISPKYIIDTFKTGDDLSEYPLAERQFLDYPVIGHPESTVNSRKTDYEINGEVLTKLSKTADRKAFWIRDATYIDYVDKFVTVSLAGKDKNSLTFWSALDECRDDLSHQDDYLHNKDKMPIFNSKPQATLADNEEPDPAHIKFGPFFGEHNWDSDEDISVQILPVVVCGLFDKVWPNKSCRKAKSESEARR